MSTPHSDFFVTGGTLRFDAPSYVARHADEDLYQALKRGEFCYVLTARQMGKSSLMVRAAARLREEGLAVVVLDLTAIGRNLHIEQWYDGLLHGIGRQLDLEDELESFWLEHERLSPLQRFMRALREVVLPGVAERGSMGVREYGSGAADDGTPVSPPHSHTPTPPHSHTPRLVLFIDEIDAARSLPFSTDEFFAAIRECYNRRSTDPAFAALTFCLLGVATPSDLIRDTRTTPFNIGRRIELEDFSFEEAAPLAAGLWGESMGVREYGGVGDPDAAPLAHASTPPHSHTPTLLLRRVLHWTGGHPYLTQRLCSAVAQELAHTPTLPHPHTTSVVDRLCESLFLAPGARERDDNLVFVRERLLRSEVDTVGLLETYGQVRRGKSVHDDDTSPLVSVLRLSGITRAVKGVLKVRNRIYARVFDRAWVRSQMPDAELRRQRAAFLRGLVRAAAVSGIIVAIMGGLAVTAVTQARRADSNLGRALASEREARTALSATAHERDRANRETQRAREAQASEHGQRVRTEMALKLARQERERALEQQQIAEQQRALAQRERTTAQRERTTAQRERTRAVEQRRIAEQQRTAAERERHRADSAEQATQKILASYLQQARSDRHSGRAGRRFEGLAILGRAAAIRPSLGLRNEAIACMAIPDVRPGLQWHGHPSGTLALALDATFQRYARGDLRGGISLRTIGDDRELAALPGPGFPARALLFSPDGRYLAARHYRGNAEALFPLRFRDPRNELRVWDLEQRKSILTVSGGVSPGAVDFSPDGRQLALGMPDGSVAIHELPGGQVAQRLPREKPLFALRFSPDGRRLALAGAQANWVKIHRLDGQPSVTAQLPGEARGLAWSPDGRMLATAAARPPGFPILVWNAADPRRPLTLDGHHGEVISLAFSHAGDLLASIGRDQSLRVWSPATGELLSTAGTSYPIGYFPIAFAPGDRALGPALDGGNVGLWDVANGRECRVLQASAGVSRSGGSVLFSRDGLLLAAAGDQGIQVWQARDGREVLTHRAPAAASAAFLADGQVITSGKNGLDRWPLDSDPDNGGGRLRAGVPESIGAWERCGRAALSADGKTLAFLQGGRLHVTSPGNPESAVILDAPAGAEAVAISPEGKWVAASARSRNYGIARVWNVETRALARDLTVRGVAHLAFTPDGRWLVTGSSNEYRFWDVGSWEPGLGIRRELGSDQPGPLDFTRDGRMMAIARSATRVQLVDPATGREFATLEPTSPRVVTGIGFSPEGAALAVATEGNAVQLWDLRLIRSQLARMGLDWALPPF